MTSTKLLGICNRKGPCMGDGGAALLAFPQSIHISINCCPDGMDILWWS